MEISVGEVSGRVDLEGKTTIKAIELMKKFRKGLKGRDCGRINSLWRTNNKKDGTDVFNPYSTINCDEVRGKTLHVTLEEPREPKDKDKRSVSFSDDASRKSSGSGKSSSTSSSALAVLTDLVKSLAEKVSVIEKKSLAPEAGIKQEKKKKKKQSKGKRGDNKSDAAAETMSSKPIAVPPAGTSSSLDSSPDSLASKAASSGKQSFGDEFSDGADGEKKSSPKSQALKGATSGKQIYDDVLPGSAVALYKQLIDPVLGPALHKRLFLEANGLKSLKNPGHKNHCMGNAVLSAIAGKVLSDNLVEKYYDIVYAPFMRFFKSLSEENRANLLAIRDVTGKMLRDKKTIATATLTTCCNAFLASPNSPAHGECLVFWAFLAGIDRIESISLVSDYGLRPLNGQETSFSAFGPRQNPDSETFIKVFHETSGVGHFEGLIGSAKAHTRTLPSPKGMAMQVYERLRAIIECSKALEDPLDRLDIPEELLDDLIPRTQIESLQRQLAALQKQVSADRPVIDCSTSVSDSDDDDDKKDDRELAKLALIAAEAESAAAKARLVAATFAQRRKAAAAVVAKSSSSEDVEPIKTRDFNPGSGDYDSNSSAKGVLHADDSDGPTNVDDEENSATGLTGVVGGGSIDHSEAIESAMIAAKEIAIGNGEIFRYVFSLPAKDSNGKCFYEYELFEQGWGTVMNIVREKLSNIATAKRSPQTKAAKALLIDRVISWLIGHVERVEASPIGLQRMLIRKFQTLFLLVAPNCSLISDDIRHKFNTEKEAKDLISTESPVVEIPDSQNSQ